VDLANPPERFWHCRLQCIGETDYAVVNDLTFIELQRTIVRPWRAGHTFTISGRIVRKVEEVKEIRIVHTVEPQRVHAEQYDAEMRSSHINVIGFNRRLLPFSNGEDMTFPLLFEGVSDREPSVDILLVERVSRRLPQAVRILTNRQRKGKASFAITDEYDVQDVLHGILRAYLKYSVQEDPISKSAGTRSARADISIQDLGVLIEIKYARGPDDQRKIFEQFLAGSTSICAMAVSPPAVYDHLQFRISTGRRGA
jgi:hypothetical protein